MDWLWAAVLTLVLLGLVLAMAEASITRMTKVRLVTLREEGARNVELLEEIEGNLPRYLNSVYLAVMCSQNGSAILIAILSERSSGQSRRDRRLGGVHDRLLRGRRGDVEDLSRPAQRSGRAGAGAGGVAASAGAAALADARADRSRQHAAARQGPRAGPLRPRGVDPLDGRGRATRRAASPSKRRSSSTRSSTSPRPWCAR